MSQGIRLLLCYGTKQGNTVADKEVEHAKPQGRVRRDGARVSGRGFTRSLLAGFTILSACRDGSHAGITFTFNGGRRNDGAKYRCPFEALGMPDDVSVMLTQALVGMYHLPDGVPAVFGLTFHGLAADGTFRTAVISNNGGQYGDRFQTAITKVPVVPRKVWEALAADILAECVSPFANDDAGNV